MFQKKMQRAAVVLLTAALLLSTPLQAATREAPGLVETAWGWLVEWVIGGNPAEPSPRSLTAADKVPIPPAPRGDDGGAIDPNG